MSDRDALEPLPSSEKPRNVLIPQIGSQTRIDPGNISLHAVKEIRAGRTQQRVQDGFIDFSRPEGGGERRDILLRAGIDLRRNPRGMDCEGRVESRAREIEIARNG